MSDALLGSELDAMVNRYLEELTDALRRLPASRRDHLVGEIREHIVELRSEHPVRDRSDMEALLNRVGLPEDIAAVALDDVDLDEEVEVTEAPTAASPPPRRMTVSMRTLLAAAAVVVVLGVALAGLAGAFTSSAVFRSSIAFVRPAGAILPPAPARVIHIPPVPLVVTVPNVVGESKTAAEETMVGAGLSFTAQSSSSATVPSGTVIAQVPSAGSSVLRLGSVVIIVSSGPATATS
jgi:uncharacterized membrane protein